MPYGLHCQISAQMSYTWNKIVQVPQSLPSIPKSPKYSKVFQVFKNRSSTPKSSSSKVKHSTLQFLLRQAFADDEASTRLLQILLFLLLFTASLMFIPCTVRSSFTLSIHFFGCLPLLLVPSTCPYSATTSRTSLLTSILVTCPNHVSLLFKSFIID